MTVTQPTHESVELDGGALGRLSFEWVGDRYQHRWLLGDDSQSVIESVESDHAQHWPVSPPLQQVYRQTFDDGRDVMFGIGQSASHSFPTSEVGSSNWLAVVHRSLNGFRAVTGFLAIGKRNHRTQMEV